MTSVVLSPARCEIVGWSGASVNFSAMTTYTARRRLRGGLCLKGVLEHQRPRVAMNPASSPPRGFNSSAVACLTLILAVVGPVGGADTCLTRIVMMGSESRRRHA